MGRPKKDPEKVKGKELHVRLSDDELERLDQVSGWAKLNRSDTIRALIFQAKNFYVPEEEK